MKLLPLLLGLALFATGCSTLGVRVDSRAEQVCRRESLRVIAASSSSPAAAALASVGNKSTEPSTRLARLLDAARLALETGDTPVYNAAVGEIAALAIGAEFSGLPANLAVTRSGGTVLDPSLPTSLTPASGVHIKGLLTRSVQPGFGVPYVAWFRKDSPFLAVQPGIPPAGMAIPVTAFVAFDGPRARLVFQQTLVAGHASIAGHRERLAADFSAPIAVLLSHGRNRSIDLQALFFTSRLISSAALYQFQPYDPKKIPVVFVHGLLSRPEAWTQALNGLLADPKIRDRYQFWFFLYPTGLPVWKSAAVLRSELERYHRVFEAHGANPNLHRMVLVGHSMGGLISSLMIREGGDRLWHQFSDVPPDRMRLSPGAKKQLMDLIYFSPREDVSRVIFVSTPHRGSYLALNPIAAFASNLIQLPFKVLTQDRSELIRSVRDDAKSLFVAPANSIRFLQAKSPLLLSILKLPLSKQVTYHSIIGDRGKGDTPDSSDGVVPYWSSHLDGAASEKIVPSGHGANENPQGIEEIRRILAQ